MPRRIIVRMITRISVTSTSVLVLMLMHLLMIGKTRRATKIPIGLVSRIHAIELA